MGNVRLMVSLAVFHKVFVAARRVARLLAQTGLLSMDVSCVVCETKCAATSLRRRGWYTLSMSDYGLRLTRVDPLGTAVCEQCVVTVRRITERASAELQRQRRLFVN